MMYDHSYYTGNNYANYLERYEKYERLVHELHYDLFRKMGLDFTKTPVLDYGCAVGFVTRALKSCGHEKVIGFDVSEWAIQYGREVMELLELSTLPEVWQKQSFGLTIALDVLEHMDEHDLRQLLIGVNTQYLMIRVPVCNTDGGRFVLEVSERDPTHVRRLTKESWNNLIEESGYTFVSRIVLGHIYDTKGVMCCLYRARKT